jgi:DNA-binding beta-propeller fold protein YncE
MEMMRTRAQLFLLLASIAVIVSGCVTDPVVSGLPPSSDDSVHGVFVVNEGSWHQDNSTLTFYDPKGNVAVQDYFAVKNPGLRLGDTGNDILIAGDRAYVTMTESQNIEVVELPSGKSLGRVRIAEGGGPREIAIVDDTLGFATLIYDDAIVAFNPRTFVTGNRIPVGPAPEGIATDGRRAFVANSGYASLRQEEPKAGTISVIDVRSRTETAAVPVGPNVIDMQVFPATGKFYALYGMPYPDSVGGVVEYDLATLKELHRWTIYGAGIAGEMAFDSVAGLAYVIGRDGVMRIDLHGGEPELFVSGTAWTLLGFYGLGVSPSNGDVYISYTRDFSIPGQTLIYNRSGVLLDKFPCGLTPGAIGFF